jgi:hypothetical protein
MRFMSVMLGLLCLPLLAVAIILSPVIVPALCLLAAVVPGLAVLRRTSSKRCWNLASYHSPHSLTWRWLIGLTFGGVFSRPRLYMSPRETFMGARNPFPAFAFNIGIAGASASTNNYGWQFAAWMFGIHLHFHQQAPMWYRTLYQRARDEADQLSGRAWFSDKHPSKVHVPPRPNTAMPAAMQ